MQESIRSFFFLGFVLLLLVKKSQFSRVWERLQQSALKALRISTVPETRFFVFQFRKLTCNLTTL